MKSLLKKLLPKSLFKKIEPVGHLLEAMLLHAVNGFPARGMKVIGVTGTNGKTSTTFMIHKMLVEAGYNAGIMSTVAYGVGEEINPQIHHMTNVPVRELIERIKWMKSKGVDWLVLETTSHALAQNRVWGIPYSVVVMTNVTHEHLDYHGTFERYRDAKRKLFKLANKNSEGKRIGIINAEDPSAELFASDIKTPITYGIHKGDLQAKNVKLTPGGSRYQAFYRPQRTHGDGGQGGSEQRSKAYKSYGEVSTGAANTARRPKAQQAVSSAGRQDEPVRELRIECHIPGEFNVYNSLAAAAVGGALGLTKEEIEKGIATLTRVEGRMDPVDEGQDFDVIVDFAHTPDSFEKLFKDLKPVVKGKLIVLFGSAGRRDEAKRAIQGRLAGEYADEVIVTEEDDRDIDGEEIMDMIAGGAEEAGKVRDKNLFLVHDRTEAIKFAVSRARAGDTVLLLGKGHEKTIERADGEYPWDEIATVRAALKSR